MVGEEGDLVGRDLFEKDLVVERKLVGDLLVWEELVVFWNA